ncbi:hypothetical protein NC651_013238 [Populus alba x Populus x berolinensis]|nr:hypothetical protein NC651_013238 [Populus alba x Populus x berolinensis]
MQDALYCQPRNKKQRAEAGAHYKRKLTSSESIIPFSAFWLRSSVVSVLISLISDTGRVHLSSLLLGLSIVAFALHYSIGLAHPTNSITQSFDL